MASNKLSFEELLEQVKGLSLKDMRKLNTAFNKEFKKDLDKRIQKLVMTDLQNRLIDLNINQSCPKCGSVIIKKNGSRGDIQRLICKDCGHSFTYFTDTFLEKTKYHWDFWIELIYLMLNHVPLKKVKATLENDFLIEGITERTLLNWRLKVMNAAQYVEPPTLTGIVEIDETFIREGQKGKKELIDPLNPKQTRLARKKKRTSELGVMGPEFSNVIVAIDRTGHCISKVVGVGSCSGELLEEHFGEHLNNATWLCTDSNLIYKGFCRKHQINHYVRPSDYLTNLHKGKEDEKTEEELYKLDQIDFIEANGKINMTYKKFKEIKETNKLSLARVNEYHSILRNNIETKTHGVSITNLKEYVAWEMLLKNYSVDYGRAPSTRKDAENILEILLKKRVNIKLRDIYGRKADFTSTKTRYVNKLKQFTNDVQQSTKSYYHLTPEDIGPNFNTDEFLKTLPVSRLGEIAKYCKIPKYTVMIKKKQTWNLRKSIEASPLCQEALIQYIANHQTVQNE